MRRFSLVLCYELRQIQLHNMCQRCSVGQRGFSGRSLRRFQGSLQRAENSGSMVEGKGILLGLRVNKDKTSVYRDYLAGYL